MRKQGDFFFHAAAWTGAGVLMLVIFVLTVLEIWHRPTVVPMPAFGKGNKLSVVEPFMIAKPVQTIRLVAADEIPLPKPRIEYSPAAYHDTLTERDLVEPHQPPDSGVVLLPSAAPHVPRHVIRDVCAASGGYKQVVNHGRNWRCVYSRR